MMSLTEAANDDPWAWADHYFAEKHRIHDNETEDLVESFFDLPPIDKHDPAFIALMTKMRAARELADDNPAYTINW